MMRVALPNKGRLSEDVKVLFDEAGLPMRGRSERSLTARIGDYEAIFVRAQDIPEFVADGAADLGITGWDLVTESGRALTQLLDLEFGRCRLVVAATEDSGLTSVAQLPAKARVATCFPNITRRFFEQRGLTPQVVPVSGAAEIAPHLGIADVVVDLTSTGSTLKVNGLRELETVLESSARLVARDDVASRPEAGDLTLALSSVLRARGQRYLMANVPKDRLQAVRECLPGLNGPTLSELMGGGSFLACTRSYRPEPCSAPCPASRPSAAKASSSPASRGSCHEPRPLHRPPLCALARRAARLDRPQLQHRPVGDGHRAGAHRPRQA